jgi:hypothetical protein
MTTLTQEQSTRIATHIMGWTVRLEQGYLMYDDEDGRDRFVPIWTTPDGADEALTMWQREGRRCTLRGGGRIDGSKWFQAELQCQREPWRNSYGTGNSPSEAIGAALAQWVGV